MYNISEKYLIENKIAYAIFNSELKIIAQSANFNKLISKETENNNSLFYEIFPEFFGLENEINSIQIGATRKFTLEQINKYDSNGNIIYLNYMVIPYNKKEKEILVGISDITSHSILKQKIRQQQNEINILKESVSFYKQDSIGNVLGNSDKILSLKKLVSKVAKVKDTTILLTGESGTGKTMIARAVHNLSDNSSSSFIEVNCATIPSNLIESELFGHVKGAFTNASENKKGLLEEADGGTLFLDEIGELPLSLQPKFLTFLETKKFRQLGSTKEISVNTRIITATNRDLDDAVKSKEFREDLYYRINVVSLEVPSLRERNNDIILLAESFIRTFAKDQNKMNLELSPNAKLKLLNYSWPGNIRELKNCIERAIIFCDSNIIDSSDLDIVEKSTNPQTFSKIHIPEDGVSIEDIERKYLEEAIKKAGGNQTKAAKLLNLSIDTFRYRLKKFNISK